MLLSETNMPASVCRPNGPSAKFLFEHRPFTVHYSYLFVLSVVFIFYLNHVHHVIKH